MRPQRSMGFSEKCLLARNREQGHVLLAYRSSGNAGTLLKGTRGERICGNFWSINAHAEQKKFKLSRTGKPKTVITANGEVRTNEGAQVYVHDLDLCVTMQFLDDTSAVLTLGKLCEEHGYTNEWASGQKPHLTKNGKIFLCNTENFVLVVVSGFSLSSSASSSSTSLPQVSSSTSPSPARLQSDDTHAQASGNRGDAAKIKN